MKMCPDTKSYYDTFGGRPTAFEGGGSTKPDQPGIPAVVITYYRRP